MDLPFDLDYVIRKAGLRRAGMNGAATLIMALRAEGYSADLLKRVARCEAKSRLDGGLRYIKEQEQLALRIEGKMTNLYLDTDWQHVLERCHRNLAWRGPQKETPSLDTFHSYFVGGSVVAEESELQKLLMRDKLNVVRKLLNQARGITPLGRRHSPWHATRGMDDVTELPRNDPEGTHYPGEAALGNLTDIEKNSSGLMHATLMEALGIIKVEARAVYRPVILLGTFDNPQVVDGYRPAIQCPTTGQQLVFGPEGSWGGLTNKDKATLGEGVRAFMGQDTVMDVTAKPGIGAVPGAWMTEVKRFSLLQTAIEQAPGARTEASSKPRI